MDDHLSTAPDAPLSVRPFGFVVTRSVGEGVQQPLLHSASSPRRYGGASASVRTTSSEDRTRGLAPDGALPDTLPETAARQRRPSNTTSSKMLNASNLSVGGGGDGIGYVSRSGNIQSAYYQDPDSAVFEAAQAAHGRWYFCCKTFTRWVVNFAVAAFVALLAIAITYLTRSLTSLRFRVLDSLIGAENGGSAFTGAALMAFCAVSVGYALLSALPTAYLAPIAAGSGISEIKCVLNGIMLPRVLHFRTLLVKVFGLIFSVSSGLPVGREGPMIHAGAIAGSGLSQGKSTTLGCDTRWSVYEFFRNDKEKRDFVLGGCASGVAAAFGAPIGGVLFAIEEGASHWHRALVWRTFFCAVVTTWILQVLSSGLDGDWGTMSSAGMFSFGSFTNDANLTWSAWELPVFVALGVAGGLFGAFFSAVQKVISLWRFKYIPVSKPYARVLEVCAIAGTKIFLEFGLSLWFSECKNRPAPDVPSQASYNNDLASFYCNSTQYNEVASLFMVPSEDAIRQLFHFSESFSLPALAVFFLAYVFLMCITYGIAVPSGLFIPALLAGSALGRLTGEVMQQLPGGASVNAGVYSLVGSAALLGGVTRMTISLAVILMECTGNYEFLLPITAALLTSRFVGNWFNVGIYDLHIELRGWPLLPDHISGVLGRELRVNDVMAKPPVVLREIEEVGVVAAVLQGTEHQSFPVVRTEDVMRAHARLGSMAGLISRRELSVLLAKRAFHPELPTLPFEAVLRDPTASALAAFSISTAGVRIPTDVKYLPPAPARQQAGSSGGGGGESQLPQQPLQQVGRVCVPLTAPPRSLTPPINWDASGEQLTDTATSTTAAPASGGGGGGAVAAGSSRAQREGTHATTSATTASGALAAAGGGRRRGVGEQPLLAVDAAEDTELELETVGPERRPSIRRARQASGSFTPRAAPRKDTNTSTIASTAPAVAAAESRGVPISTEANISSSGNGLLRSPSQVRIRMPAVGGAVRDDLLAAVHAVSAGDEGGVYGKAGGGGTEGVYAITVNDGHGRPDALRFMADEDILELLYTDEPLIQYADFQEHYPRYPDVSTMRFSDAQKKMYVDLRPYLNPTPFTVHVHTPIGRAFELFRSLGLHHMVAVNDAHDIVGLLTRHDLMMEHMKECLERKQARQQRRTSVDLDHDVDGLFDDYDD